MPETYLLKRPFDILLATMGLMFFLPFWGLFTVLVWLEGGGSIFYIQERVGWKGELFKTFKFRTLFSEGSNCLKSSCLGRFLRVTALDESLQLINILKGDMSFVGPRPLISLEIGTNKEINLRSFIRPGLTGLAQILISKDTPIAEKFKYDLWYIENQSLLLDLRITLLSFLISFRGGWESKRDKSIFNLHVFKSLRFKELLIIPH